MGRCIVKKNSWPPGSQLQNIGNSITDSAAGRFFRKVNDLYWIKCVDRPAKVRTGSPPSILDYIITHEDKIIENIVYDTLLGKSDHVCVHWDITLEPQKEEGA